MLGGADKLTRNSKLRSLYPSDQLSCLRELAERFPVFGPVLKELIQLWFVVDANVIQGELRWRLGNRKDPNARSSFHECIESGLFVAVAPVYLKAEIEEHLPDISADEGVTTAQVTEEWERIQHHLFFYQPQSSEAPATPVADRDDLPYKFASDELGLPVYSRDVHFRAMSVPVIAVCLDMTARNYGRAASITIGTTIHSTIAVTFAVEAVAAVCRMVTSVFTAFMRLPQWVQLAAAGLLAGLLIHPKSRAKLVSGARAAHNAAAKLKPEVLSSIAELFEEFANAAFTAHQTGEAIRSVLPRPRKRTALMYARTVLVTSQGSLAISELENRVRAQGYASRACDLKRYLRRVMRKSGQFLEVSPGLWSLKTS